ncbi:MAG: hypothetical protein A2001_11110 [Treponema sp. GWC1_61_84]|nr:MAG: hypothetical protein A2001_11110 [Treponema sp. GWC1_61_84]
MKKTIPNNDDERAFLIQCITSDSVCKEILARIDYKYFSIPYSKTIIKWVKEYFAEYGKAPRADIHTLWKKHRKDFNEDDTDEVDLLKKFLSSINKEYVESIENNSDDFSIKQCHEFLKKRNEDILAEQITNAKENGESIQEILNKYKPYEIEQLPEGVNGNDLLNMEFPELVYIVPEMITLGSCVLLVGGPKLGKSWFVQQLVTKIAEGGVLFRKYKIKKQRNVLYLADEDTARTLYERIKKLKCENISRLHIKFEWSRGDQAIKDMRTYLEKNPRTKLVVIDPLVTVMGDRGKNDSLYQSEYNTIKKWWKLSKEMNVTILIIHHSRKALPYITTTEADVMDMINGSNGLGGAADQIMVLVRKRNCPDAKLFSMGRAVKDLFLGLHWEDVECSDGWSIAGDMEEVEIRLEKKEIISIMAENGGPMSQTQIARLAKCSQANVSEVMKVLVEKDLVEKVGYAKYKYIG